MKKITYLVIILIFITGLIQVTFASETPEEAVIDYYEASLTGDVDIILSTMNMSYITEYLASETLYREYVKSAFEVMSQDSYTINSMNVFLVEEKNEFAVVYVNITSNITWTEWAYPMAVTKDMVVFLENTSLGWKVNFVMDRDLFDVNQGLGMMALYSEEVYEITSENSERALMISPDGDDLLSRDDVVNVNTLEWASMDVEAVRAEVIKEETQNEALPIDQTVEEDIINENSEKEPIGILPFVGAALILIMVLLLVLIKKNKKK